MPSLRIFLSAADLSTAKLARLTHPRTAAPLAVCLASSGTLLEVQKFCEGEKEPRSWLLAGAERVQQDSSLFLATPLDPIFLILPRLRALRGSNTPGYFRPMSELSSALESADELEAAAFEATVLALPEALLLKKLRLVCDVNDKYDEPMVRLNDTKLLAWLQRKVKAVQAKLTSDAELLKLAKKRAQDTHSSQFDILPGLDTASGNTSSDEATMAVSLVAEYLEPAVQAILCAACDVSDAAVAKQRGGEKKAADNAPAANSWGTPAANSWDADVADADAEVSRAAASRPRDAAQEAPVAKKPKPAPTKSKAAAIPLKKGQQTMMGFFSKPK